MYRFFFFHYGHFLGFSWALGEAGRSVLFLSVGPTIENMTLQSQKEFSPCWLSRPRSFLNCCSTTSCPLDNQGQDVTQECLASVGAENMYLTLTYLELDTFKQIPLPYFPVAPTQ